MRKANAPLISFCDNPECICCINDPVPCEEFVQAFHRLGRCGRCGWQHDYSEFQTEAEAEFGALLDNRETPQ